MKPLDKTLRGQLERTVQEARDVAEAAAVAALKQLGVDEKVPFSHLSESERELRRRLRDHGRQLGDTLNGGAEQSMDRLVEEVAYEHWHRMLFARFLAENNLLMYPDPTGPVPVTLEECEDLAAKEGAKDGWELAARYAARMLPQIFRIDSPVFQLILSPEYQQRLEQLVAELPAEVFAASDSLGWVYQFWQSKKKDEINASEVKIGARELPAVTQLFTEPYMVNFLLDNTLGAWWAARILTKSDFATAKTEEELRQKASLPGVPLEYLRFIKDDEGLWTPAAGTFESWPERLFELKVFDPCCGSGHFLVAAFLMLVPMRMEIEGLSAKDAVDSVLRDNLNGLEIDRRCVELTAFALAFAAWCYSNVGGYRQLPELNVACCGLTISAKKEDWLALAGDNFNLQRALEALYDLFKDAPVLGSLINPEVGFGKGTLIEIEHGDVAPLLDKALSRNQNDEESEMGVVAQGIAKAAQLLSSKYNWVITNVPYLARGKQSDILQDYCEKHYSTAKNDLATVFLDRCIELCCNNGTISIVLPQNWLFLISYKGLRQKLLQDNTWHFIVRLGPQAFQTPMWDFNVQLFILSRSNLVKGNAPLVDKTKGNFIHGLDVTEHRTSSEKALMLPSSDIKSVEQIKQLMNPDARVILEEYENATLLSEIADYGKGSTTGDAPRFLLCFWEFPQMRKSHVRWLNSPTSDALWSGRSVVCTEPIDSPVLTSQLGCWLRGQIVWNRNGVVVSKMNQLHPFLYSGEVFDDNICPICPKQPSHIPALWAYVESNEYHEAVRRIDQKLNVTAATLVKVPFNLEHWTKVAKEKYPDGLPKQYSEDLTQWIFHGYPAKSSTPLQVAVARLLGYRWPAELDCNMELSEEAHAWARKSEVLLPCADEDGIVCIPSVRGEMKAEDMLEKLLAAAYRDEWSSSKKSELLAAVGYAGKTLESWLREKFFTQHCKLFHDRPFIWHIWDGLSDGFAALVNYHKLDAKKLETLIYTYLGDWISRQKQDLTNGVDGAGEKLAAADGLKKRLELILEGESPYDIFVRWKPLEKQPVGWNPDLNDGVRLNIRPFMSVSDVGKKGAGVLRDKPNISWGNDRGRNVESAPWYKLFMGERINDHHLSLAEKRTAKPT